MLQFYNLQLLLLLLLFLQWLLQYQSQSCGWEKVVEEEGGKVKELVMREVSGALQLTININNRNRYYLSLLFIEI